MNEKKKLQWHAPFAAATKLTLREEENMTPGMARFILEDEIKAYESTIAEQKAALVKQEAALVKQEAALEKKDREIARLRAKLTTKKKRTP